ncbi:MAG: hypothetical protein COV67_00555 [Nitrospinae bacterium CG11_big_fil_rev_8_21_14_0_20_56_8]|nr:MAG: hypothetical protein COV67_00555 [Nitrospinae bacterium CG11_big_fil_rev_8_21_14_0_20_56_8]
MLLISISIGSLAGFGIPVFADGSVPQHISGAAVSAPPVHVSGSVASIPKVPSKVKGLGDTDNSRTKVKDAKRVVPDSKPENAAKHPPAKPVMKEARNQPLEDNGREDRVTRRKACWTECAAISKAHSKKECGGLDGREQVRCKTQFFDERLTCVRDRCSDLK